MVSRREANYRKLLLGDLKHSSGFKFSSDFSHLKLQMWNFSKAFQGLILSGNAAWAWTLLRLLNEFKHSTWEEDTRNMPSAHEKDAKILISPMKKHPEWRNWLIICGLGAHDKP